MDGIINVYKEKGYTSHDVVAKMRGILRMKKIGHTGTLDPQAEGVLPVCLGAGTKLCDMLADRTKTYRAVLLLGQETDTQDTTGQVLAEYPVQVTEEEVHQAARSFLGTYMQIPPMYSALKFHGKKLYELARAGKEVERQARPVEILELTVEQVSLPRVTMLVTCSKGTYIRTLCHDIGRKLGCGGCMESLVRTRVERFCLEDSVTLSQLEQLRDEGRLGEVLYPVDQAFSGLLALRMEAEGQGDKLVHNGNPFYPEMARIWEQPAAGSKVEAGETSAGDKSIDGWEQPAREQYRVCQEEKEITGEFIKSSPRVRVYDSRNRFIGVYEYREDKGCYHPFKIFPGGS